MVEVGPDIWTVSEFVPPAVCDVVLKAQEEVGWTKALPHCYIQDNNLSYRFLHPHILAVLQKIHAELDRFDKNNLLAPPGPEHIQLSRGTTYKPGGEFKSHFDCPALDKMGEWYWSVIVYLNDDYTGGHLVYPRHGVNHVAKRGDVVVHLAGPTHPHTSTPLLSGQKFIVFNRVSLNYRATS